MTLGSLNLKAFWLSQCPLCTPCMMEGVLGFFTPPLTKGPFNKGGRKVPPNQAFLTNPPCPTWSTFPDLYLPHKKTFFKSNIIYY